MFHLGGKVALHTALQELPCIETWDITRCDSAYPAQNMTVDCCTSTFGVTTWLLAQ